MTLTFYASILAITLIFIALVVRIFYYALTLKKDPIKAIIPKWPKTKKEKEYQLVGES